jgi:predicted AlkP superfamily pyrophosphatase or phosphodiesterase
LAVSFNKPYTERADGIINWLQLPINKRPKFITLYIHDTDSYGHEYGPDSPEIDSSISRVDSVIGYLEKELAEIGLIDSTNIIIVADHGMTEISNERVIELDNIIDTESLYLQDMGTFTAIDADSSLVESVYNTLKATEDHYKVYLKEEIPDYYFYNKHPFILPILVVADLGWSVAYNLGENDYVSKIGGNHGYEKDHLDMHGIFIAKGPSFRKGFKTGTLWNIDIYPLLCKIFGISPRTNIDGKLERIGFILK